MTPEIGTFTEAHFVLGKKGYGKSHWAIAKARQLQQQYGAIIIGHSPRGLLGARPFIEYHKTMEGFWGLERGVQKRPEKMHILSGRGTSVEEVLDYGLRLSYAIRKKAIKQAGHRFKDHEPAPKGVHATPVVLLVDEGVHAETQETAKTVSKEWMVFLTSMRHEHMGLIFLIQSPTSANWKLLEQADELHSFRYTHEYGLQAMARAGVPQEDVETIPLLDKYERRSWRLS